MSTVSRLVYIRILLLLFTCLTTKGAVVQNRISDEIEQQGLYSKSDKVTILAQSNFDRKVYDQSNAWLIEFYNSFCGHCRAFAPRFKEFSARVVPWQRALKVGVVDCAVEENIDICRRFEVMQYPTLRYLHENFVKGNANIGESLDLMDTSEKLIDSVVSKLQTEQESGRLQQIPSLDIGAYSTYVDALKNVPSNIAYTFLVFETANSKVGPEVILDTLNYPAITVKRVYSDSELAREAAIRQPPSLVAVRSSLEATHLTPKNPNAKTFMYTIDAFLKSKNFVVPEREITKANTKEQEIVSRPALPNADVVYLADLETAMRNSLTTEITRYKTVEGESLSALLEYLNVLIDYFPFRANGKEYLTELRNTILTRNQWTGAEIGNLVKTLETRHAPVYTTNLDYVACKGSEPQYRGYTCGLWAMFHTLTVNAALQNNGNGPKVLRAMHGYVKNFFGCTDCQEHFQAMAARNRIFDVKDNDKAVLWLWISHNEVNLRLAGDSTEDPKFPKIQFPSAERCPECRLARGAWNLPAVYRYLQRLYAADNIQEDASRRSAVPPDNPLSTLDMGLLSLLYMQG